jgi:hypothetical protein
MVHACDHWQLLVHSIPPLWNLLLLRYAQWLQTSLQHLQKFQ